MSCADVVKSPWRRKANGRRHYAMNTNGSLGKLCRSDQKLVDPRIVHVLLNSLASRPCDFQVRKGNTSCPPKTGRRKTRRSRCKRFLVARPVYPFAQSAAWQQACFRRVHGDVVSITRAFTKVSLIPLRLFFQIRKRIGTVEALCFVSWFLCDFFATLSKA